MENFRHKIETEIRFGKDSIKDLREIIQQFGQNVLLVYGGGSIKRNGIYDKVYELLNGFNIIECSGIEPNPRIESVEKGSKLCKENHIDVVLAVGGGSVIDCAKAICVGAFFEGKNYWDLVTVKGIKRKALPLVDILTLSATGSEFDGGGVISNLKTNEKMGNSFTYPAVSICDPVYTYSVNKYQTAAGSIDIMSHIIEGYFSRTMDVDLSEGIAETVLKSVIKNLPIALEKPDDYTARANLMMASSIACSGIPEYGKEYTGWVCHALEHELSAYYDITHGVGLAILTPRWMKYILDKDKTMLPRFVKFAKNVFNLEDEDKLKLAYKGIDALDSFFRSTGIPMSLSELNIDDKYFKEMAAHANRNDRLVKSVVSLTQEDAVNIYRMCL